ncbi:uncharacterized protein LOC144115536 [Amblyomma americanum]
MSTASAPGPDGIPTSFYARFYTVLEEHLLRMVKDFVRDGVSSQHGDEDGIVQVEATTEPAETTTKPWQTTTSMLTTTLGSLAEFCPDSGNIDVYVERFDLYSTAKETDASKKLQVFLTILGEKAYVTLRSLLLPKKPTEVKHEKATEALRKHYAPKRSVVTAPYHFYQRKQEPNESLQQFIVELKRLAATCSFGSFLEEALRDRLIAGIGTDSIRCRLLALSDDEVTWERVCKIATALETAQKDTREILPVLRPPDTRRLTLRNTSAVATNFGAIM